MLAANVPRTWLRVSASRSQSVQALLGRHRGSRHRAAEVGRTVSEPVRLCPESVRAIAAEVVAQLEERRGDSVLNIPRLVDAATVAAELNVSRAWVYDNADALGAIRLGEGERPRLRFDVERARATRARSAQESSRPSRGRPAAWRTDQTTKLLPIRGVADDERAA